MIALAVACSFALAPAGEPAEAPRPPHRLARGLDERIELVSAIVDDDAEGAGLTWMPNERCEDEAALDLARIRFRSEVQDRRDWLRERRNRVDALLGHEVLHLRTRHFELAYGLGEIKAGRKRLKPFDAGVLYATRLEDYVRHVLDTLAIDESALHREGRHEVFLVATADDAVALTDSILGNKLGSGFKSSRIGHPLSALVMWRDPEQIESDEQFHQILVHALSHHVYHDVGPYRTWLYDSHGWLYEGLAYFDEIRLFGPPITTCHPDDALDFKHWLSPYWEANVRKAIKTRRDPEPARVFAPGVSDLRPKERQFAWSYVDFLIWRDPAAMVKLLESTKGEGKPTEEALMDAYGLDLASFQSEWREFVASHYKSKPRRGPTPARDRE